MTGFDDGTDKTDYFRGLFSSPRYRWADIKLVGWIDTDRRDSYVPYADALIYAATSSKVEFNFKSLPGYVELYPELPDQLEMVENLAENGAVDVLLDLAATIGIYRIFDYVADKLKQSVGAEKRLAEKAYIELDRRYDDARRDLDALARQMKAVEYIFGEPREGFTNRVRYHWTLVKLQRANHEGRPEEGERLEAELADIRQAVLKDGDAELLVHGELYRMVSLCDRLEFEAALQLAQQTLPLASRKQSRGRVLSSMGQHLSFLGRFTEAEEKYRMALDLFARADLTDEERAREITQTTTYRVMNATDGKFDPQTIWSHYQELIDPNLEETMASTMESPYLHHLMVRTMFWLQNQEKINWYLERRGEWLSGSYHPWELVNLYRAIFLVQAGDRDGARSHFEKAYAICQSGGAILQLIGAMILLVQRRLLGRSTELDGLFQSSLTRVQEQLPEAVSHVDRLQGLYESPNAENLSELLVLPFNYH